MMNPFEELPHSSPPKRKFSMSLGYTDPDTLEERTTAHSGDNITFQEEDLGKTYDVSLGVSPLAPARMAMSEASAVSIGLGHKKVPITESFKIIKRKNRGSNYTKPKKRRK